MIVTTADGKKYKIERNRVVEAKPATANDYKNPVYEIPMDHSTTVKTLIDNTKAYDPKFSHYDAKHRNCQTFVHDVLTANNLQPKDPNLKHIIEPQNSKELVNSLGVFESVPKALTDIANVGENLKQNITGGKIKRKTKRNIKKKKIIYMYII